MISHPFSDTILHGVVDIMSLTRLILLGSLSLSTGQGTSQDAGPAPCATPVYLSINSPAYSYLERRQHDIYEANPSFVDPFSRDALNTPDARRVLTEVDERLEQAGCDSQGQNCLGDPELNSDIDQQIRCGPLPTRFESPLTHLLLRLVMSQIDPILNRMYPQRPEIAFGTLPTGNIDAQALHIPDSTAHLVLLNRDVFQFTGAFSKSVTNAIPIDVEGGYVALSMDRNRIRERLRANPQIVRDFAEAVVLLVLRGSPSGANEVFLDARLVGGLDTFVVTHEISHILLNHTGRSLTVYFAGGRALSEAPPPPTTGRGPEASSLSILERNREQELAADALGFQLLVEAYRERGDEGLLDLGVAAAGADVFFGVVELADRYAREVGGNAMSGAAHPTAQQRSAALDRVYAGLATRNTGLGRLPDFRPIFRASLAVLSEEADPIIRAVLRRMLTQRE
jgi:hypothetical protein